MIQFLNVVNQDDTVGLRVVGKISREDIRRAAEEIDQELEEGGRVNLYMELDHFEGYEPKAFFDDLRYTVSRWSDFERVVIISQQEWLNPLAKISDALLPNGDVRYYHLNERASALRWLREESRREA